MSIAAPVFNQHTLIRDVLETIRGSLNQFIANIAPSKKEWVALSNLFDHSGNAVPGTDDKIVMMVANIEHETTISTFSGSVSAGDGKYVRKSPPVYINLYLLFYANMAKGNYEQGLSAISSTISFFQQYRTFNRENTPSLDPRIDKLTFEFNNLDLLEWNHVLGLFGANYLPSVLYKVRLIPFKGEAIFGEVAAVKGVQS